MTPDNSSNLDPLQKASFLYERGSFLEAHQIFGELLPSNLLPHYISQFDIYFEISGELNSRNDLKAFKELLLQKKETSLVNYLCGMCDFYLSDFYGAHENLQKCLTKAFSSSEKIDACYAILGLIRVYFELNMYEEALQELENLDVFFGVISINRLKLISLYIRGRIYFKYKDYQKAQNYYLSCSKILSLYPNSYYLYNVILSLIYIEKKMGTFKVSTSQLWMLYSISKNNMPKVFSRFKLQTAESSKLLDADEAYDLSYNKKDKTLFEKEIGSISFVNNKILSDLLEVFIKKPGVMVTKDEIAKVVWKQKYKSALHDNRIYATIKRLRNRIEPDLSCPKYIFIGKNGYFLSREAKILIKN